MSYAPTGKIATAPIQNLAGLTGSKKADSAKDSGVSFANLVGDLDRAGKKAEDATYRAGSEKDLIALSEAVNEFDMALSVAEAVLKKATKAYDELQSVLK